MNIGWQFHEMKINKKKSNERTPVNKSTKYGTRSFLSCFMPRTVDDDGRYEAASPAATSPQTEDNPHGDMTVRSLSCSSNQPLAVETATAVNVLSESPAACQCPSQTAVKDTNILKEASSDVHGEIRKTQPCYVTFDSDSRRNSRQSDKDAPELPPRLRPDRQSVTSASAPDVEWDYSEIKDDSPPPLPLRADANTKRKSLQAVRPSPRRKAPALPASDHETDEIRPTYSDQTDLIVPRKTRSNQAEPNECDRDSYVYAVRSKDMSIRFAGEEIYGDYDTICETELGACDSEVFDVRMQTLQVNDRAACCSESTFESTDSGMFEPRTSLTDCGSKDNVSECSARSDTDNSDDDDNGATIEDFKDASAVSNFRTRALAHKNLRRKISSFMFNTDEVTVILRHDCKLDKDTFDVEQLARELGTKSSLLKLLKLTKPPVIELMAGPGESVRCFPEGRYNCAIKCTGGCYIFANGKTYLLMTAHNTHRNDVVESVGQHGQLGRIVKRIEQVRSRVTYDMALVELTISGAEDVRNVVLDVMGNTAAVLDTGNDGVVVNTGDTVRKFASGSNAERQTGTVTHVAYYHEDGPTFRDCYCVAPDADSEGFSQPGVSGTLLTTLPSNANDRRVSPIGMTTGRVWMETEQFGLHASGACPSAMHFAVVQKWSNIVRRLSIEPGFENMQLVHASDRRVAMQCTEHFFRTLALGTPDNLLTTDTSLTHLATNVMPRSPLLTVAQQVSDDVVDFLAEDTFGWPVTSHVFPPPSASAAASASPLPPLSSPPPPPKPPKRPPPRGTTPMVPVSPKLYIPVRSSTDVKAPVFPPRIPPRQHSGVTEIHESAVTLDTLCHSPRHVPFEAAERSLGFPVQLQAREHRLSELVFPGRSAYATVPHPDTVIPNARSADALEDKPNYVHMYADKDDVPPPADKAAQRPQHHEYCEVPEDLPTDDCQSGAQSAASQPTPTPELPPLPSKRTSSSRFHI